MKWFREHKQAIQYLVQLIGDEVAVGIFGHRSLRTKYVFGEEVHRTALIGHRRGIGVTENVYEKIQQTHQTRVLPAVNVKWQNAPLKFWEVIVSQ